MRLRPLRGRPVGAGAQDVAFRIGFAMVLMLMVFATWNDIFDVLRLAFGAGS